MLILEITSLSAPPPLVLVPSFSAKYGEVMIKRNLIEYQTFHVGHQTLEV